MSVDQSNRRKPEVFLWVCPHLVFSSNRYVDHNKFTESLERQLYAEEVSVYAKQIDNTYIGLHETSGSH